MGGGTEAGRMLYGSQYLDSAAFPPKLREKLPADGDGGGTFNHGFLLQMNGYVSGSARGRAMLKEGLEIQRREGHCCRGGQIETNSASHGQLNEAAAGVALYHAVRVQDGPILELLRDWWWSEMALCLACEIPGAAEKKYEDKEPLFWGPGWRATQDGKLIANNPCRDLCGRLILGHPVPPLKRALWRDKYNLAARALSLFPADELKALRPAPGWTPPLPYPFHARRAGQSFLAWFDAPETERDVARFAGFEPEQGLYLREGPYHGIESLTGNGEVAIDFPGIRA